MSAIQQLHRSISLPGMVHTPIETAHTPFEAAIARQLKQAATPIETGSYAKRNIGTTPFETGKLGQRVAFVHDFRPLQGTKYVQTT